MNQYEQELKVLLASPNAIMSQGLGTVDACEIFDANNEDNEFFNEFTRVIDDTRQGHVDDVGSVEAMLDNILGMQCSCVRWRR